MAEEAEEGYSDRRDGVGTMARRATLPRVRGWRGDGVAVVGSMTMLTAAGSWPSTL